MGDKGRFRESVGSFWGAWVVFWGVALGMGEGGIASRICSRGKYQMMVRSDCGVRTGGWNLILISRSRGEQSLARFVFM